MKRELKKPAIFLDRDGVLVEERSYITNTDDLRIFPYTAQCIQQFKELGYYTICISNQSAVGRGMMQLSDLQVINQFLITNTYIDAIYCCPHYWKENIPVCDCRKPQTGLFKQAMQDYSIDLQGSYMVGDRATDILAGQNIGVKTILLESGYGSSQLEADVTPDHIVQDLRDVVQICKKMQRKKRI